MKNYLAIPYEIDGRRFDSIYDCYDGAMMLYWKNADKGMLTLYCDLLQQIGYEKHQAFDCDDITSATFRKGSSSAHVYFLSRTKELRAVAEYGDSLPINPYEYQKLCDVAVTQLGTYNDETTYVGMGYLIRLEDGTFVVIDGGQTPEYDAKLLYNTMLEQKPDELKEIVITAWILTHGDGDHFNVLNYFMDNYNDQVIVKRLIGNDVSDLVCKISGKERSINFTNVIGKFGDCVYDKAHTGQRYFMPGAIVTILHTHEDWYPNIEGGYNNTSTVFDIVIQGETVKSPVHSGQTRFLFLGDIHAEVSQSLMNIYDTNLECDVMQMAHHGIGSGWYELYKFCKPRIAYWPAGKTVLEYKDGIRFTRPHIKFLVDTTEQIIYQAYGNHTIWFGEHENNCRYCR